MWFTEEKLRKHLDDIRGTVHREKRDIRAFRYLEGDFEALQRLEGAHAPEFDDGDWAAFEVGGEWGGYDRTAWFRTEVTVPEEWREGKKLALRFLVGPRDGGGSTAEALLYVNGEAMQGIDVWHEEAWLPPDVVRSGAFHIALKAWSGVLRVPDRRRFKLAQLVVVDECAERLYFLGDTMLKAAVELPETDLRRTKLLKLLNEAALRVDWIRLGTEAYYDSVREAWETLSASFAELEAAEEIKPKVIGFGHSHIDMAWLWRLAHSREKASRTFATVLHLMRQYPEYRFLHTSPQLYKFLKQDYPDIYREVKAKIASGEWEIAGGMWVEPDTNVPNGESLIRQVLFGKRFIEREFGRKTNVVFLPDVFGYSWALPQIIRGSGIDFFMTSKISWSQYNRFPYDTFLWRGADGTEILTHFITTPEVGSKPYTYNGIADPYQVKGTWDQYKQKDINDELILAFGWGDGGGGPTKEMLEAARAMKNMPGLPRFELGKLEPYLERLAARVDPAKLPVWDGELYLEYHRGTYTSQAFIKRANRLAETLFHNAEWASLYADWLLGASNYPQAELNEGWEKLLLNQFHDILPGSSIRQVYDDAREDFREIERIGRGALDAALRSIADRVRLPAAGVVVFNSLSRPRGGLIELPWRSELDGLALEESGLAQTVEERGERRLLLAAPEVPSLGYRALAFVPRAAAPAGAMTITPELVETALYRIRFDERGHIVSLYDKRHGREALQPGKRGNVLQAFEDRPMKFDAWDIDLYYQEKLSEADELIEAAVEEEGPLRGVLRLVWRFHRSTITQRVTVYAHSPRIDFRTEVDWQEKQVLLKAAFPIHVRANKATYDIQFGSIERPTHWNTSWDYAKFEVCAQKWADLSEGNYGVALLNDCKYGYDAKDNTLRLTLIKSPVEPDETADRGRHEFTYALLPHAGGWREGRVVEEAYDLNVPLLAAERTARPDGELPGCGGFASLSCDHAMVETVKKAEDDDACIVRVYEYKQCRADGIRLAFGRPIRRAALCNLVEEGEAPVAVSGGELEFSLRPFEIKTFKIWF
ncbi:alpha-mannosidase [Paenibacillus sp.]|uniref:alpha-mannosidase n=1 Tax=Paenibacillus sp. TaxID=58172 RepID=UPI002D2F2CD7|nr:alpha-mannosidase [Paenibacillus sp.]HZG87080.1 alpha-mannosidase [Paenibacillus sp.]